MHIQADIEYSDATSEVIFSINNKDHNNIFWHGKNIFSATKKEDTRETSHYYYKIQPQKLENFYTIVISSKSETIVIHSLVITMVNH